MDQNITATPPAPVPGGVSEPSPPVETVARPVTWTPGLITITPLVAILAFFLGSFRASNSDIWMTLATGKLIAAGQYQFGVDPFSWATTGAYWANSSWLTSWIAYLIYSQIGPSSLVIAKALCVVAMAGFLFASRSKDTPLLPALEITALGILVASPRFMLQSTILSFLLLACLMFLLTRGGYLGGLSRDEPTKPGALWQIPLLFLAWSNLDSFFVLGLAVLAFVAIGLATFAETRPNAKRLATILGLSIVACVANPHLFANFTLPNELAVMFDGVLPGTMTTAGRTAAAMNDGDPGFFPAISPLTSYAITNPLLGYNFAGFAFYLLMLVNIGSFIACIFVPEKRALAARGLVCLILGLLAAFQFRLIPFYAIAAVPLTMLNITDYARWSRLPATLPRGGVRFATLTTFVAMLTAVVLAWPGWLSLGLNRFTEDVMFQAPRRVDWELQPEQSLLDTVQTLKERVAEGQVRNVLNFVPELAHYCAFFAPEVKCGIDWRLSLFAGKSSEYSELRNDLWAAAGEAVDPKRKATQHNWAKRLAEWQIDALVLTHQHQTSNAKNLELNYYLFTEPTVWKPIVADGQTFAFQYSPKGEWPENALLAKWQSQAFGPVPAADRLPDDAPQAPPVEPLWLNQYARGPGLPPLETSTAVFNIQSFQKFSLLWQDPYFHAYQAMQVLPVAGNSGVAPGLVLGMQAGQQMRLAELVFRHPAGNQPSWFHSIDLGPAALPVLTMRELRRSLAKNKNIPATYAHMATSVKQLTMGQDAWWCRGQYSALRQQLRFLEVVTAQRSAVTLAPWSRDYHMALAGSLISNNYLDAAQLEFAEAVRVMDEVQSADPNFKKMRDGIERQLKQLDFELKKRRNDFELKSPGLSEFEKFALAVSAPFRYTDAENNVKNDPRGRGLVLEGLKILERMNPAALSDEQKHDRIYFLVRLNCFQGKINEAVEIFTKAQKDFNFSDPECAAWIAVATGWYKSLDEALASVEVQVAAKQAQQAKEVISISAGLGLSLNLLGEEPTLPRLLHGSLMQRFTLVQNDLFHQATDLISDYRTLRGSYALERGDTAYALQLFESALTNDRPFNDRAIAVRCRDLLRESMKK